MDEKTINTTTRWNRYCRAKHKDGRICDMYSEHLGKHTPRHGTEKDQWEDEDCEA